MVSFERNTMLKGTKVGEKEIQVSTEPSISLPIAGVRFQARLSTRHFIMA